MDFDKLSVVFESFLKENMVVDAAHDIAHIKRVVKNGLEIGKKEHANLDVIFASCWLHDCVNVPKTSNQRSLGSKLSADKAVVFLKELGYPIDILNEIHHAIHAHSFSANIEARTLEAKIVQDSDRMDALGALGIARCLMYSAGLNRQLYNIKDPFCENRLPDENNNAIDHFYIKLKKLPNKMKTEAGKNIANERWLYMEGFLNQLKKEIRM